MRLGIMLPNWIGDLAMATPALRAIRKHFADSDLVGFVRPYAAAVLGGSRLLDRIVSWEHRGWRSLPGVVRMARELRRQRIDTIVLMRNSVISAFVARASGARKVVGYERPGGRLLLTDSLPIPKSRGRQLPVSAVDSYLALAYELGCPPEPKQLELATTPEDEAASEAIWKELRIPNGHPAIMLNTGGAYGGAKHWPVEHGAALARRAAAELGVHVVINCGPGERAAAEEMASLANHRQVKSLAHLPPRLQGIGPSKAFIRRMRLMVSTDSGPRHLAAALGVPTIGLFGPIDPALSANYQPGCVELRLDLPCSPCGSRTCPLKHHRCMRELTVEMVFAAVKNLAVAAPVHIAA